MQTYNFESDKENNLSKQNDQGMLKFLNGDNSMKEVLEALIIQHMDHRDNDLGVSHD